MNPDVIRAAAGSPLGILALLVLVVAGLALTFFRRANTNVRLLIFGLILISAIGFGIAVFIERASASKTIIHNGNVSPTTEQTVATKSELNGAAGNVIVPAAAPARARAPSVAHSVSTERSPAASAAPPGQSIQTEGDCSPVISHSNTSAVEIAC